MGITKEDREALDRWKDHLKQNPADGPGPAFLDIALRAVSAYDELAEAYEDTRRLARELDAAMHGEDGAAQQASLCDLIGPAKRLRQKRDEGQQVRMDLYEQIAALTAERDELDAKQAVSVEAGAESLYVYYDYIRNQDHLSRLGGILTWLTKRGFKIEIFNRMRVGESRSSSVEFLATRNQPFTQQERRDWQDIQYSPHSIFDIEEQQP